MGLAATVSVSIVGCSAIDSNLEETKYTDTVSAFQLVNREAFENIDLVRLLDPTLQGPKQWENQQTPTDTSSPIFQYKTNHAILNGVDVDFAFTAFDDRTPDNLKKQRRNEVQERILAASVQRCNTFKGKLQRDSSRVNFWLGVSSTTAAAAGAVVQTLDASRVLSGVAAALTGARAEYDQSFFANLSINVIVDGIEARQRDIYTEIVQQRAQDTDTYTIQAAVKDALYFHGACSIVVGLQYAEASIKTTQDPGIDAATRIMLKAKNLKAAADNQPIDTNIPGLIASLGVNGTTLVSAQSLGAVLSGSSDPGLAVERQIQGLVKLKSDSDAKANKLTAATPYGSSGDSFDNDKTGLVKQIDAALKHGSDALASNCRAQATQQQSSMSQLQAKLEAATTGGDRKAIQAEIESAKAENGRIIRDAQLVHSNLSWLVDSAFSSIADPTKSKKDEMDKATQTLNGASALYKVIDSACQTNQVVTFGPPPSLVVGGTATVTATSYSGLVVTYSSTTPKICSISGSTVTGLAAGTCTIVAPNTSGAGGAAATLNITVSQAPQT
jgi:hypothetical protein